MRKSDYGFIFWVHLFIILFWCSCPFLFSWYFLLIGVIFSYTQAMLIGGCVLTHKQFGDGTDETFWRYYLEKMGIKLNRRVAKIIFFWIEPTFVFIIGIIWQVVLGMKPLII